MIGNSGPYGDGPDQGLMDVVSDDQRHMTTVSFFMV